MGVWVCGCVGVWVCGCVGVWVCGCVGVWVCGCVGVWVCGCVGVWVCGCVGVWVCGCVGVWVCEWGSVRGSGPHKHLETPSQPRDLPFLSSHGFVFFRGTPFLVVKGHQKENQIRGGPSLKMTHMEGTRPPHKASDLPYDRSREANTDGLALLNWRRYPSLTKKLARSQLIPVGSPQAVLGLRPTPCFLFQSLTPPFSALPPPPAPASEPAPKAWIASTGSDHSASGFPA